MSAPGLPPPEARRRSSALPLVVGLCLVAVVVVLIWWLLVRDDEQAAAPLVPAGEVTVSSGVLDFGDADLGRRSSTASVVLSNGTAGAIRIEDVRIDGEAEDDYAVVTDGCLSARLAPGDACSVSVRFVPTDTGARPASLVFSLDGGPGERTVDLLGAGVGRAALVVGVTRLDYGERPLDATAEARDFALTNVGTLPVRVTRVAVSGPAAGDFTPTEKIGCLAARTIDPGEACVLRVSFSPSVAGGRVATLLVAHTGDGGPARVQLRGTGLGAAEPRLSPSTVDLGRVELGAASAVRTVTLTNAGAANLPLVWVSVAGGDSGEFELAPGGTCRRSTTIEPGASCTARVRFVPEAPGRRSASLVLASDGTFVEATLRGTGVAPPPQETTAPTGQAPAASTGAVDPAEQGPRSETP